MFCQGKEKQVPAAAALGAAAWQAAAEREALGGRLHVDSAPGEGTRVLLETRMLGRAAVEKG